MVAADADGALIVADRLLDTNVFSFLFRRSPLGVPYQPHIRGHNLFLSFMSVAEVYEWGYRARWGPGRFALLRTTLRSYVIIPFSDPLARRWAEVRFERRQEPIGVADAWLAATALDQGMELVTHNPGDFRSISGLRMITEAP
jgi:predicted nucleic acid-binding protein